MGVEVPYPLPKIGVPEIQWALKFSGPCRLVWASPMKDKNFTPPLFENGEGWEVVTNHILSKFA